MRATLFGKNKYRDPGNDLRGCVNDANHLWLLLVNKMESPTNHIFIVKDAQATARYEKELVLGMIQAAGPGDRLLWSDSCHGSNNPDPSQADGLQELICCYDITEKDGEWDEETVITARWIGDAIRQLHPEATLDILLDCCHAPAGGQLKQMALSYDRARFMPRPVQEGVPYRVVKPEAGQINDGMIPENVALWSACQPEQTSADAWIDKMAQGAFTAAFLRSWAPKRCRSDIIYYARLWLDAEGYAQIPHLYCHHEMAMRPFGA